MPKITFTDRSQVPEGLEVSEVDGKFVIDVVNSAKLNEFRDNNIAIAKERDTLKKFYETVSPLVGEDVDSFTSSLTELQATAQQVKDGKLKASDQISTEVENRVKTMRDDLDRQLQAKAGEAKAANDKASEWEKKFKRTLIDQAVTQAAISPDNGVEPTAIPDLLYRAYSVFSVENDGKVIPKDGEAIIYGSDGATPMTTTEWVKSLQKSAPHMFKRSAGGGAEGGGNKGLGGMSAEEINKLSAAQKIALARRVK